MTPLLAARMQMALTLGFHILFACLGVGLPVLMLFAEWRYLRTGDEGWKVLARRWSKAFAVLFAVGAVSGTVLSFELGLLWPQFMGTFGSVIALPFTLEAFAFFLEAIFVGIYLYAWDRLSPKTHWWCGVPVAVSGLASAWFVVTANAWMNAPLGFRMADGIVIEADPLAAMMNPATGVQTAHMILAAYMVSGFLVAGIYAAMRLRGACSAYHRRAMNLGLAMGLALTPVQMIVGHWAAQTVAQTQPVKFAAMEGQFKTEKGAPLRIGGISDPERGETRYAIEIPGGLSWLAYGSTEAIVHGLKDVPPEDQPPVAIVHGAFQMMVLIGTGLVALAFWSLASLLRKRRLPSNRWYWRFVVLAAPLSVLALEAGWVVTEVGRQPWIVHGFMRTSEAVTEAPGIGWVFLGAVGIYGVLSLGTLIVLRLLAKVPLPESCRGA